MHTHLVPPLWVDPDRIEKTAYQIRKGFQRTLVSFSPVPVQKLKAEALRLVL
jgi:hypothetical protein